jgi:hypothetical protein
MTISEENDLKTILFPKGTQFDERNQLSLLLEQYKLFVDTEEKLVARRQNVNTFFLSLNTLLLAALGIVAKEAIKMQLALIGVLAISLAGFLLCIAWYKLVHSYRQLNAGKFAIIHLLEEYLPAALFKAEWIALGEGRDKKKYTPFTKTEAIIPFVFVALYVLSIIVSLYLCR